MRYDRFGSGGDDGDIEIKDLFGVDNSDFVAGYYVMGWGGGKVSGWGILVIGR